MTQEPQEPGQDALWGQLSRTWQEATTEQEQRQIEEAAAVASRKRTAALSRSIFWRNLRELLASALVVIFGIATAVRSGTWSGKAGGVCMALGALYVGAWIFRHGKDLPAPGADAPTSVYLVHEIAQIERQARLLEQVRSRYLAPLLPGVLLMLTSGLEEAGRRGALSGGQGASLWAAWSLRVALVALVFGGVDWLNRRAARTLRLQQARVAGNAENLPQGVPGSGG